MEREPDISIYGSLLTLQANLCQLPQFRLAEGGLQSLYYPTHPWFACEAKRELVDSATQLHATPPTTHTPPPSAPHFTSALHPPPTPPLLHTSQPRHPPHLPSSHPAHLQVCNHSSVQRAGDLMNRSHRLSARPLDCRLATDQPRERLAELLVRGLEPLV